MDRKADMPRHQQGRTITWNGQQIQTITVQYLAYSDGRIQEIVLDWFAQADDGAVWYLGEDVTDYKDGVVDTHQGSWLAGRDGPAAMIMPARRKVGDVHRTENAPGIASEEVTVTAVGQTITGPGGSIHGALVVSELHTDGTAEDKIFGPGYGEFSTGSPTGDLEQASLAVPTDARPGPPPAQLTTLSTSVRDAFDTAGANDWAGAAAASGSLQKAWDAYQSNMPEQLQKQMSRDIDALARAVAARNRKRPIRPRYASRRTTWTCDCATNRSSRPTWPACSYGHASCWSTPPTGTPTRSPATSPPSN